MKNIFTLCAALFLIINNLFSQSGYLSKTPLYEVFSSSDCPNCAKSNPVLNNVLNQRIDKYVAIKNQEGFPGQGDPYYNKENDTRLKYYGLSGVPTMAVNGIRVGDYLTFTTQLFDEYAADTTAVELTTTYTQTNNKNFDVSVILKSTTDLNGKLRLFVVLCEKHTTKNKKTNGETEFFHVAKKYINSNGSKGMPVDNLIADKSQQLNITYEVKGEYRLPPSGLNNLIDWNKEHSIEDFNNLEIAVFLQDSVSKKVYQSAYAKKITAGVIDESFENNKLRIYPNPANGKAYIAFTLNKTTSIKFDIYNVLGAYISTITQSTFSAGDNTVSFDTSILNKGIYFISVYSEQHLLTKKIIIN